MKFEVPGLYWVREWVLICEDDFGGWGDDVQGCYAYPFSTQTTFKAILYLYSFSHTAHPFHQPKTTPPY